MAQFDVYHHPIEEWRALQPYVVDVQSSWVQGSDLRLTVPLLRKNLGASASRLYPQLTVQGEALVLDTLGMAAYPVQDLRARAGSLQAASEAICAALDYALYGY